MAWDVLIALIGGLVSGVVGGWIARGAWIDRSNRAGRQSSRDGGAQSSAPGGSAAAHSGQGDINIGQYGSARAAQLAIERRPVGGHVLIVVHNDGGDATARKVNFVYSPVGDDAKYTSRDVRAMGPLDDIPPKSAAVNLARVNPQNVSRGRQARTFCVEWTNPDGTVDSVKRTL